MKKLLVLFVSAFCVLSNLNGVLALNNFNRIEFVEEVFEDGSYIETTIEQNCSYRRASTTSGSKTSTYKDSNNKILWSVKVSGSFTYTGSSATCTGSSISTTCPDSMWKLSNKRASRSGASAIASVTAKEYTFLGICAKTVEKTVKLSCSTGGKLS